MPMNTSIRTLLFFLLGGTLLLSAPKDRFLICIDPGHPSETSDGASANGLSENHLNWEVAQRLAARLKARGIPFVLTKNSEKQRVTNRERAEIANGANSYKMPCTAFIRLHCDTGGGSGFMWYYPDRSGTKEGVTGPSHDVQVSSRRLAETMNEAMKPVLKGMLGANSIKTDAQTFVGGKQGGVLTGSIFSRVPTALIEMCFINSKADAEIIASAAGQDRMADALLAGIEAWRASR